ncbi:ATP-dependent DNA ligase [Fulvivirga sp. RKSG066]|uniref:ATP-dependent DNA ligase n=1 Tax=Fulvivirga aurantia TaxID=2529383 RepID=UPI0012BBD9F3|nr:ATP-dependent DNA ligase [Fulvivirga aurantia]MTI22012.1 ATP-dependent DNA ligase [Fulvivirga aurantia]
MKHFSTLFTQLDQTTKTLVKVQALVDFFTEADDEDKIWAIAILSHRRPKRTVKTKELREWAAELANLPNWLFEESYHVVGDLAETIALSLPVAENLEEKSLSYWISSLRELKDKSDEERKEAVVNAWMSMGTTERYIFNKIITGGFRMGVSQKLMTRALAKHTGIEESMLAHRLMGNWSPDSTDYENLILSKDPGEDKSRPYPFYLAYALEDGPEGLGKPEEWIVERKWDGIRGQIIVRGGEIYVWSRGEELVTDKYPEYEPLKEKLPDGTVLDGEILPFKDGSPLPFNLLQTRIGRKNLSKNILQKAPVVFKSYDVLEWKGEDIREKPFKERREILERLVVNTEADALHISEVVHFEKWQQLDKEREDSRQYASEGLMVKRADSTYQSGRKKGDWWKWKVEPLTVDAVMIYAMRGHGRRANLYTDYTFAVWDGEQLVPFTKAYSGLTDKEINEVDRYVKRNTIDRFGPVRSVTPELVFEIAFEGINKSTRHKSGIALRFPRIKRWRKDKPKEEANTLEDLHQLLEVYE